MHILYIHQYFKTPEEGGGTRSYWISQELLQKGHQVTMITSRNKQEKKITRQNVNGINVIYIRNFYDNNLSYTKRINSFIKFIYKTIIVSFRIKKLDLVYATSTPITVGIPALLLWKLKRIKYIFEVRDLWPDVPIEMGIVRNTHLKKMLLKFEKRIYLKATYIIALSPGMKREIIQKGIHQNKITVASNMCDLDTFYPKAKSFKLHQKLGIHHDSIIAVHTGAMGMVNGLLQFTEKVIKKVPDIVFVFIGDGQEKQKLQAESIKLNNLFIMNNIPKTELNEFLNDADIFLMLVDPKYKIFETNSANKFFDYLSIGKPIVMNYKGWKYEILQDNQIGYYLNQENAESIFKVFSRFSREFIDDFSGITKSRDIAEKYFSKEIITDKIIKVIQNV